MAWKFNPFTNKLDKVEREDLSNYVQEAPEDGVIYGRRNGEWDPITLMPPVDDWWDPTGGLPEDPEVGDRYLAEDTGSGWTADYIYEWDGEEWVEEIPIDGWMIWILFELIFYVFFSGGWMEVGYYSYWSLWDNQTGIEGNKSGSFDLTTTGVVTAGDTGNAFIAKSGTKVVYDGT